MFLIESALTGELKICRIDKYTSSCEGGEEVFILVEKVSKSKFVINNLIFLHYDILHYRGNMYI